MPSPILTPGDWVSVDGQFGPPMIFRGRTHDAHSVCRLHWPGDQDHGRDYLIKTRRLTKTPEHEVEAHLRSLPQPRT
jgi:hypothetical protein